MGALPDRTLEIIEGFDEKEISKIVDYIDLLELRKEKEESEINKKLQALQEFCDFGKTLENPWSSEEEMIEELKEDRKRWAGKSLSELKEMYKEELAIYED